LEQIMASNTQETRFKRHLRRKNAGRARKAKLRNHGTTPVFAIHTPEADALAPNQARGGGQVADNATDQS
jgi:hypothetical protein